MRRGNHPNQQAIPFDVCASHHGGNPESIEANLHVEPTKAQTRASILSLAQSRGVVGITADEVAALWDVSHNHVAPRITELKIAGELVPNGRRRNTRTGSPAAVLVASASQNEPQRGEP